MELCALCVRYESERIQRPRAPHEEKTPTGNAAPLWRLRFDRSHLLSWVDKSSSHWNREVSPLIRPSHHAAVNFKVVAINEKTPPYSVRRHSIHVRYWPAPPLNCIISETYWTLRWNWRARGVTRKRGNERLLRGGGYFGRKDGRMRMSRTGFPVRGFYKMADLALMEINMSKPAKTKRDILLFT